MSPARSRGRCSRSASPSSCAAVAAGAPAPGPRRVSSSPRSMSRASRERVSGRGTTVARSNCGVTVGSSGDVVDPPCEPGEHDLTTAVGASESERRRNRQLGIGTTLDPHPLFDELRAHGDVHEGSVWSLFGVDDSAYAPIDTVPHFMVIGYDACLEAFRAHDVLSSRAYGEVVRRWGPNLLSMDEPDHRRYRALVQP